MPITGDTNEDPTKVFLGT